MAAIRIDPRRKHQIMDELTNYVYEGTKERFNKAISDIAKRNCALTPYTGFLECFTYKGVFYNSTGLPDAHVPPTFRRVVLHHELRADMDKLLKEQTGIHRDEKPFVLSLFTRAMNMSECIEDYKLMFPECMTDVLKNYVTSIERQLTDEQIQEFIRNNEKALDLLRTRKVLDLILT
jgi:hypothetical protein